VKIMAKEIVLIGRSNVGKSTLFKELTGKKVRIGRRPGITREPVKVKFGNVMIVDMPGFGFMKNLSKEAQERNKDFIVGYFEENKDDIRLVVQVIDVASFLDIVQRWESRGEMPAEIELYEFLDDLGLEVVIAANKMDRIADPEKTLDQIVEKLGMLPPWRQWLDRVAPISAKKGEIESLRNILRKRLQL
jgi:small GTP-binding protein